MCTKTELSRRKFLTTAAAAAVQIGLAADDLHHDTLPRVNAWLDQLSVDSRDLEYTLHLINARPQSLIFGPEPLPPGPSPPPPLPQFVIPLSGIWVHADPPLVVLQMPSSVSPVVGLRSNTHTYISLRAGVTANSAR